MGFSPLPATVLVAVPSARAGPADHGPLAFSVVRAAALVLAALLAAVVRAAGGLGPGVGPVAPLPAARPEGVPRAAAEAADERPLAVAVVRAQPLVVPTPTVARDVLAAGVLVSGVVAVARKLAAVLLGSVLSHDKQSRFALLFLFELRMSHSTCYTVCNKKMYATKK